MPRGLLPVSQALINVLRMILSRPRAIGIAVLVCATTIVSAAQEDARFDPHEGPQPLLVIRTSDPWLWVIGSDTPSFVLYKDRSLVAWRQASGTRSGRYVTKRLDSKYFEDVVRKLRALASGSRWEKRYATRDWASDQPTTAVFVQLDNGSVATSIYGPLSVPTKTLTPAERMDPYWIEFESEMKAIAAKIAALPEGLRDLLDYVRNFDTSGATSWRPKFVEVMLWPCRDGPKPLTSWPHQWPGLDSKYALKRGDQFSVYLEGRHLDALKRFESRSQGKTLVDGNGWCFYHRFVFPSEPIWVDVLDARDR